MSVTDGGTDGGTDSDDSNRGNQPSVAFSLKKIAKNLKIKIIYKQIN